MIQQPAKSMIMALVNLILNFDKISKGITNVTKTHTMPFISTICNHLLSSGMKSVAPEKATALAPTRPQYSAEFSLIPSRNGRPCHILSSFPRKEYWCLLTWKLMAKVDTCCDRLRRYMAVFRRFGSNLASRSITPRLCDGQLMHDVKGHYTYSSYARLSAVM